jgi:serine/threonine-protein kinase
VAPEAVTDPENVGPGADLYALGAVGYFLLTGKRVFEGKNAVETCIQHVTATPQPPSAVSALHVQPELEAILMKCLAKRPADRFESAAAMADAIRGLPSMKDWDVPDAHLWWRQFRAREQQDTVTGEASTITITVDLGERA